MSESPKKSSSNGLQKTSTAEEQQAKINEVKKLLGQLPEKLAIYCSDASISRYLRARNWKVKKAIKMLKDTLKWRAEYKPEEIRWEEIAHEAETGKIYRSNYFDKHGRSVLVMRPSCQAERVIYLCPKKFESLDDLHLRDSSDELMDESWGEKYYPNTKSTKGQIRYLVYCMENAVLNLPPDQEQMVWLIDFHGFNLSNISLKVTRETAHVLQDHYPERLGVAILYNAPKFFEPFWLAAKAFLDPKTYNKVKFVYSGEPNTMKIMEDLFDIDELDCAFGGRNNSGFDISKYAERMRDDDKRMPSFGPRGSNPSAVVPQQDLASAASLDSLNLFSDSDTSDNDRTESSQLDRREFSAGDHIGAKDPEGIIRVVSPEQKAAA